MRSNKEISKYTGLIRVKREHYGREFLIGISAGLIGVCLVIITSCINESPRFHISNSLAWSLICAVIAIPFLGLVIYSFRLIQMNDLSYMPEHDLSDIAWAIGVGAASGSVFFMLLHINVILAAIFSVTLVLAAVMAEITERQLKSANDRGKQIETDSED